MASAAEILDKALGLLVYDTHQPLIFNSGLFLFLFAGFLLFYALLRRSTSVRIIYVILFSLYFYYKSSGVYFLLLVFAAASDYWIARALYRTRRPWLRRSWVVLSIAVNIGMLGYFKYTNFLIDISNRLFGEGFLQFRNIFLPVGISFFVFQSLSYTIDIYRRQLRPLDRWTDYLFYLSFFPQLVAGPIVRAKDFIPQIRRPLHVSREMFGTGVFLILTGLFKKAIVSDYISLNFVDRIFDEPLLYSGFECLAGIYGYALQIYCDFSGYSDMAIGIALLLGFRFPRTSTRPTRQPPSPSSGADGTFRFRRGCATTSTSLWAATARGACAPTSTSSSRCFWAACGTAPPCASSSGVRSTARRSPCTSSG